MKRLFALLMALIMVLSVASLVACNNDEQPGGTPDDPSTGTPSTTDPSDGPTTPSDDGGKAERIPLDLPDVYYGGTEPARFHILQWSANGITTPGEGWIPWEEGAVMDETGDLISNAVFSRNAYVAEKYGVKITSEYLSVNENYTQRLTQDAETSSNEFQLASMRSLNVWPLIEAGLFLDMNEYAGSILHTDQPWWVPDAVNSYTLGDSLYVCATEMLLRDKGATATLYFNTKLANDHGLNYFYDMVESGDWTMEDMVSACDVVATSLDGDDLLNSGRDRWGITCGDDTSYFLYAASGLKFAHIDDDGYVAYDFGDKRSIDTFQRIFDEVMYADWYQNNYLDPLSDAPEAGLFESDLALFLPSQVKTASMNLREMETEYGILPMPKYDASQDDYYSLVWVHHDSVIGIPSCAYDLEMCATVFEALSYEGYYSVTPVLYETLLLNRMAKTAEAKRSYEIIFNTRVYDPGQYWDLASGITDKLLRHTATGNSNIASLWEANRSVTETQMEDINEFIDASR